MGGFFSSKTKTTKQPYEKNPWEPQQEYLKEGFEGASAALEKAMSGNANISDFVANLTPEQKQAMQKMASTGAGMSGGLQDVINQNMAGAGALSDFSSNAANMFAQAGQDRTGQIIDNAGQYADNPYLKSQIDAAIGDVREGFDRDVASINSGASGTGNINSTRAGVLESRALDDSMDRAASISSSMRGAAYDRGLGMAQQEAQQSFSNQAGANAMIGQGANQSFANMAGAFGLQGDALQRLYGAGSVEQAQNQSEIEGQLTANERDMDLIQRYMQAIGGSYGGEGYTTKVTEKQSPFQTLIGGAATAAGMGWSPFG